MPGDPKQEREGEEPDSSPAAFDLSDKEILLPLFLFVVSLLAVYSVYYFLGTVLAVILASVIIALALARKFSSPQKG